MKILIPLPDHPFYLWQALVQYSSGVEGVWLVYKTGKMTPQLEAFMRSGAKVIVWDDWRSNRIYNPSMKPGLVGQYLKANPTNERLMVIDPDVIPTGRPLPKGKSEVIFGTDTDWYTGPDWLKSKGVWDLLCKVLDTDPEMAASFKGIGAQYIFQNVPGEFWLEVSEKSTLAFDLLRNHPVDAQPWCAEMYVTHILAAKHGYKPTVRDEMSMVWANGPIEDWGRNGFYHNAGVTKPSKDHFYKGAYQFSPFDKDIKVSEDSASKGYVDFIEDTKELFPELIW